MAEYKIFKPVNRVGDKCMLSIPINIYNVNIPHTPKEMSILTNMQNC